MEEEKGAQKERGEEKELDSIEMFVLNTLGWVLAVVSLRMDAQYIKLMVYWPKSNG